MNTASRLLITALAAAILCAGCSTEEPRTPLKASPAALKADCYTACVSGALMGFDKECNQECSARLLELGVDPERCAKICLGARADRLEMARRQCNNQCILDADGDGVPLPMDNCPETTKGDPVDIFGCLDTDQDGVADSEDECPKTDKFVEVARNGCELEIEDDHPACETPQECDLIKEIPLEDFTSFETRQAMARRVLSLRYHDLNCPGKNTPPEAPKLIKPVEFIDDMGIQSSGMLLLKCSFDGEFVPGEGHDVLVEWAPVVDDCPPVAYSVFVEYYYCHEVEGIVEPHTYEQNGSCRWMPYLYQTTSDTKMLLTIHPDEIHYQALKPFAVEQYGFDIDCANCGPGKARYDPYCGVWVYTATIWVRIRVTSHDGNGTPSGFGEDENARYLVFEASVSSGASPP